MVEDVKWLNEARTGDSGGLFWETPYQERPCSSEFFPVWSVV